jgi:hypothetical protein
MAAACADAGEAAACGRMLAATIAAFGFPPAPPEGWDAVPLDEIEARARELGPGLVAAVGEVLALEEGARSRDPAGIARDVAAAGLAMVLGGGKLVELALRCDAATGITERAYRDLLLAACGEEAAAPARGGGLH